MKLYMSQSDYLNFKRVSNELKINKFTPVFNTKDYIDFKEYSIHNNITNTKLTYNQLCPSGYTKIFNMEKKVTNCPAFIVCRRTNIRPNRVPLASVYFTPDCKANPIYVKQPKNAKTGCNCMLDSINTLKNICNCKISQ